MKCFTKYLPEVIFVTKDLKAGIIYENIFCSFVAERHREEESAHFLSYMQELLPRMGHELLTLFCQFTCSIY